MSVSPMWFSVFHLLKPKLLLSLPALSLPAIDELPNSVLTTAFLWRPMSCFHLPHLCLFTKMPRMEIQLQILNADSSDVPFPEVCPADSHHTWIIFHLNQTAPNKQVMYHPANTPVKECKCPSFKVSVNAQSKSFSSVSLSCLACGSPTPCTPKESQWRQAPGLSQSLSQD